MKIKKIIEMSGLNQSEFSRKYDIPLRTIQDWNAEKRTPPEYVLSLLEKAVNEDIRKQELEDINKDRYLKGKTPGTVEKYWGSVSKPTFGNIFHIIKAAKCDINMLPDADVLVENLDDIVLNFTATPDFQYELTMFNEEEYEKDETVYVTYTGRMNADILSNTMCAFACAGGLHYARLFLGVASDLSEKEESSEPYNAKGITVDAVF